MGSGLLTIHMSGYGEAWDNTWGISINDPSEPITQEEIDLISADSLPAITIDATTDPSDPGYGGAGLILAAVLGFTRAAHPAEVAITGILLNDGSTPGEGTGPFWSLPLLLNCVAAAPTGENVAPLSIALLINRGTNVGGVKPGRLYWRAVLQDTEVYPGSRVGVTWPSPTAQTNVVNRMATAATDSGIGLWTPPTVTAPSPMIVIPHYGKTEGVDKGQVISGYPITSIVVNKPVSRQLTRGRRRTTPTPP